MTERCHYCHLPATHTCLVIDMDQQGYNLNERGYTRVPICVAHALEMRSDHARRVEPIEERDEL